MTVVLYKKLSSYKDKDGVDRKATNLFLKCGSDLIPIQVKYFPDKESGKDERFAARKAVVIAFAEDLPEKQ